MDATAHATGVQLLNKDSPIDPELFEAKANRIEVPRMHYSGPRHWQLDRRDLF
jgi:hypothetical protein